MGRPAAYLGQRALHRTNVARGALELVDAEGAEALTFRRLGARLGVKAQSLYTHVKSKEDLLAAVSWALLGDIAMHVRPEAGWREWLGDAARFVRGELAAHPRAVPVVAAAGPGRVCSWLENGAVPEVLVRAGFSVDEAFSAVDAAVALAVGFAQADAWQRQVEPKAPADQVPEAAREAASFSFVLGALLDGLDARRSGARRRARPSGGTDRER